MTTSYISRTGRVQSWLDNPESRLPVSCTVFVVEDSMEGPDGIEASWKFASHALRNGAGVAIHLSKLRPKGTETIKGSDKLVASGPVSFGKIFSTLNEILRRGGTYRNGAIVLHLDLSHPDALDFISASRYLGSRDASTSPPNGGRGVRLKRNSSTELSPVTSGSTK
jgi:ribonucleotide reductase alpha subunit